MIKSSPSVCCPRDEKFKRFVGHKSTGDWQGITPVNSDVWLAIGIRPCGSGASIKMEQKTDSGQHETSGEQQEGGLVKALLRGKL